MSQSTNQGGVGSTTVLLIVFVVLKLTGNIDWSWWWVLSPMWMTLGLILLILPFVWFFNADNRRMRAWRRERKKESG